MNIIKNEFRVFEYGKSNSPSIIFVHGFPYDHFMWDKVIENLSDDFYCVTYDVRGLGSSNNEDVQFTIDDLADDLFSIIDMQKIKKPYLCGLSMGGYISLRAVEKDESSFTGLILMDTKSAADSDDAKFKRAAGIKKINQEGVQKFCEEFVRNCFAEESIERLGDEYIAVLGRSMNSNPAGVKGCLLAMAARTDTTSYLSKIKIPTLLLCGDKDKLTPPDVMKEMADKIKGAQFFVVPSSGHMSAIENPEFVCEKIRSQITRIK